MEKERERAAQYKYPCPIHNHKNDCGRPGINGGYIKNNNVKRITFGNSHK